VNISFSKLKRYFGFTLIELMLVVAIVAIISAIAIPAYMNYVRRSYLSEATASISAIKSAEESFFTINNCYVEAREHPTNIPSRVAVTWDDGAFLTPDAWARNALGVRPDRTVRFQYRVYASNALSGSGCGGAATYTLPTTLGCVTNVQNTLVPNSIVGSNWYIVNVRGDLDGNASTVSNIISAIDDSTVIMCSELN
jgi:prepilin-type N-terminal cleavage/methylation domain-containing protein